MPARYLLLADWLRANHARLALVRPDRYVYGIAPDEGGIRRIMTNLRADFFPDHAAAAPASQTMEA